jgi:peptidoglycan hydrolase FlgJ
MTISSIGSLTAGQQKADTVEATPEQRKAARDFEAIFLRQLLSGLEKGSGLAGSDKSNGAQIFGSMMVGALADTAAEGGGIGLSELILKAMLPPSEAKPSLPSASGTAQPGALQGATPTAPDVTTAAFDASLAMESQPNRSSRIGTPSRALTEARSRLMLEVPRGNDSDGVLQRGNSLGVQELLGAEAPQQGAAVFRVGSRR